VLLLVTLLRLALNVASTRVVLMHGHEGRTRRQGHRGLRGIRDRRQLRRRARWCSSSHHHNFVVVTKGAGRVSEVSARFALDAMPGKQMAIDADLNAGIITQDQARERRAEVRAESDFYGSMDGASKFVRGDAVAGILIMVINIIGGLLIGTMMHDLPAGEATKTYTLLTIGDGLVAQIPGCCSRSRWLSSYARHARTGRRQGAGQAVVRPAEGARCRGQRARHHGPDPGMPNFAFLSIAALAGWGAWQLKKDATNRSSKNWPPEPPPAAPAPENQELSWDDVRPVDVVGLEVGYRLVPLVDRSKGGDLLARIRGIRRKLTQELGFLVQPVHIRDNLELGPTVTAFASRAWPSVKAWFIRTASWPSTRAACSAR
jgi:flagellar biosynthesis protein FlhA